MKAKQLFPKDFLWGASTSSHQVEGGTDNQWSVWELAHAADSAKEAPRRLGWTPKWAAIRAAARDPHNYVSNNAVEHLTRYKADFELVKDLHMNAFRFSLEWSRIEPEPGVFDIKAITYYQEYIKELNRQGLEPLLNIWHWTVPTWFEDMGGFVKKSNLKYFDEYVDVVARELLQGVNYVLTVNEINNYATFGYLVGNWPPGQHNPVSWLRVYRNLTQAHINAYTIIKRRRPATQVGAAHQITVNTPLRVNNYVDRIMAKLSSYVWSGWFFNKIQKYQDFVGFNYYFKNYFHGFKIDNPTQPLNDMGWYMEPSGIYDAIMSAHRRYGKPIIITENGVADQDDAYRKWWLSETLVAMGKALQDGADLRGYLHWSLLDNFEWAEGWWPKFGLYKVDRENNMQRTPRPSATWLASKIKHIRALDK